MKRFRRHVEHILDPKNRWSGDCFIEEDTTESSQKPPGNASARSGKSDEQTGTDDEETRREQLGWFRVQYQELLSEVKDRIDELEGLRAGAKSTADSVSCSEIPCHAISRDRHADMEFCRSTIFLH